MPHDPPPFECDCRACRPGIFERCLPLAILLSSVLWIALWATASALFPDVFAH